MLEDEKNPAYLQQYFYATWDEAQNRMNALMKNGEGKSLDKQLFQQIIQILNKNNVLAKSF